ncbi:DUF6263 family protein [uncultured Polaribacter sp.]|uniref:DUF6263 family protein n=1 Tax=uncultured Polaribacter sp. TaxID=174711 RepID=UPI00260EC6A2|nr:DUF6263 family protein [uncultured Polaribacter sp.]
MKRKKLLILFLVISTTAAIAQESVKLRLNYNKGDKYIVKTKQSLDSKAMGMNNSTSMVMEILEVNDGIFTSEMKVEKIVMDMMQGGMFMAYDSSAKEEDIDEMGKMLKPQIDPMLKLVITSKVDKMGKVINVDIAPSTIPNAEQFKTQTTISFPEKALKVGGVWKDEKESQGVTIKTTYTVKEIKSNIVVLSATGTMSGIAEGTLTGNLEIDKSSGTTLKSIINTVMNAQGQEMKMEITTSMEKM